MNSNKSLVEINREFLKQPKHIVLDGEHLTIPQILSVARHKPEVTLSNQPHILKRIRDCYEKMMEDVRNGVPIYGCNTGYGGRASLVLNSGTPKERIETAKKISEGIAHIDVTTGPPFSPEVVRGAMVIRINMLMHGVSAVKIQDLEIYKQLLNHNITPLVGQYGGIGASGDLAHNARVLSAARHLPGVKVWDAKGVVGDAAKVLKKTGVPKLLLDPKAGLGLVNGDNFSTSLAALLLADTVKILLLSNVVGAMVIEVLKGTNRSFHPLLSSVRPHTGQIEVANLYRYLLDGSKLAYQEMKGHVPREDGVSVQDGYSLRALSQYHGVNFAKIKSMIPVVTTNANSVSDNPLWVSPEYATRGEKPWQWVSGGNFIASQMVEVMDGLRKTLTQIVKLNDRHLARMVTPHMSNGLPPNLSDSDAITHCAFKGTQIQSGMMDVYSSLLSIPVSTFFGVHEEANQDITSHALTSGIFGLENLRLTRYSTAQNLLAVAQAVDLRGGGHLLSPRTRPAYEFVREKTEHVSSERPLGNDIETLYDSIVDDSLLEHIDKYIFSDFL